jgi:hypothetical protein
LQILKWGFTSREDTNFTYKLKPANIEALASAISIVTGKSFSVIKGYIDEIQNDVALRKYVIDKTQQSDQRNIADQRFDLHKRIGWYAFSRALKPMVIIETGVDKGLGSVSLCASLLKNKEEGYPGKYYGTDINSKAGYLLDSPYSEVGKILFGDSIASLESFNENVDLFINDSDHSEEYEYREYQIILPKLSNHAVILGDNSHVTDKLLRFSIENNRQYLFFKEEPEDHWYPGGGIGISFKRDEIINGDSSK